MAASLGKPGESRFNKILEDHHKNFEFHEILGVGTADMVATVIGMHPTLTVTRYVIGSNFGRRKPLNNDRELPGGDLYPFFELKYSRNHFIQNSFPGLVESIKAILSSEGFQVTAINDFALEVRVAGPVNRSPIVLNVYPAVDWKQGAEHQWSEVLGRCSAHHTNVPFLHASAIEKLLKFLDNQDPFTKKVAKLAKIWDGNTLRHLPNSNRRPMIIELVAIKAGQEEIKERGADKQLGSAMGRFFEYLKKDLKNLRILFDKDGLPGDAHKKYDERLEQTGILIDPVNPFVNYLDDAKVKAGWKRLGEVATLGYRKWTELQQTGDDKKADQMLGF